MKKTLWIFAALVPMAIVCGGAKIASDQFMGHKAHDIRLVGAWKGRWVANAHGGKRADVRLNADGTGVALGRPIVWDTEDAVFHVRTQDPSGARYASVPYNLGRRGSAVAFDGGPQDMVPLMMARV